MTEKVLSVFNINKKNVLAVVTDNASNMVRMVKDMNIQLNTSDDKDDDSGDDDLEFEDEDPSELVNVSLDVQSDSNGGAGTAAADCDQDRPLIYHMRCAAHSLALSVKDGTDERHTSRVIALVREIVKVFTRFCKKMANYLQFWMLRLGGDPRSSCYKELLN